MSVIGVVNAVIHKIHQIRNHRLSAFLFQQFHKMVVGQRHIFDQDFSHNTDLRFPDLLMDRQLIKSLYNPFAYLPVLSPACARLCDGINGHFFPLFMESIC